MGRDMFKLHAFGLEQYEAVVFYDNDASVAPHSGDPFNALFRCARQGYFLGAASSGAFAALSAGFMALRPSKALLRALRRYLRDHATYTRDSGWESLGWAPWNCLDETDAWCLRSRHVAGECGQGLHLGIVSTFEFS